LDQKKKKKKRKKNARTDTSEVVQRGNKSSNGAASEALPFGEHGTWYTLRALSIFNLRNVGKARDLARRTLGPASYELMLGEITRHQMKVATNYHIVACCYQR
jgi:hypothetical protein